MLARPFLTALDSRAAVKGSVDPLGIQALWTHLGRYVVGNLTTVSNSVSSFTVLLVGYYLAERVAESDGSSDDVEVLLKWEQLAAYARAHALGETGFRGTTRTHKFLSEGTRVTLGADPAHQILGSQKTYGIFGLYSNPARTSALLEPDEPRLTSAARELVERRIMPLLARVAGPDARRLVARLGETRVRVDLEGRDAGLITAVVDVLRVHTTPNVRELYRRHLLFGGPLDRTDGRQRQLASAFSDTMTDEAYALGPGVVDHLIARADASGHADLVSKLGAIRTCESAMAPLASVFGFALQRDGATVSEVARELVGAWGRRVPTVHAEALEDLQGELTTASRSESATERWIEAAHALRAGHYEQVLRVLLAQNAWVMQTRGGTAWVEERQGTLHVRLRYDEDRLPDRHRLPSLWRHAYFLDSVRSVARSLEGS